MGSFISKKESTPKETEWDREIRRIERMADLFNETQRSAREFKKGIAHLPESQRIAAMACFVAFMREWCGSDTLLAEMFQHALMQ